MLQDHDVFLAEVHERLLQAQQLARQYYDANHRNLSFEEGDWSGSAYCIVQLVLLLAAMQGSWVRVMQDCIKCWQRSCIASSC